MNQFKLLIVCLLCLATCGITTKAQDARAGKLTLEPYSFRTFDGNENPAELGKLWVRENRNGNSNRLIQLAFVRLKSTASQPAAPIIWLAGGPGTPGIVMGRIPPYFNLFNRLREVADVILLDQRGSGMSLPNLKCQAAAVPLDVFENADKWLRAYTEMSGVCAESWRKQGVDLAAYTTNANADDVDELRQALGAKQISLIGHSYGTVLAQDVIRRHGGNLQRVVFASSDAPDTLLALPTAWDLLIKKLSYFASEDATVGKIVPDMEALYKRVLDKLERNPVSLNVTDERAKKPVNIRVGKIGLQWLMRLAANDARIYAGLPALLYTIEQGDYSILTRQIEPLYNGFQGRSPMANAINCSDGWSAERLAQVRREASNSTYSNVNLQWTPEVCKAVGITNVNVKSQTRIFSTLPALFLSGSIDTNTPPFQAEEVRWGFPNSVHLVVENGGHETLPDSEVQTVIVDFFKGQNVKGRVVSFERPRFLSIEEAKSPKTNRR
jgi:pimeloyl-ACP methyl ester carboxylesterase